MLLVWRKSAHLLGNCSRGILLSFSHTNIVICRAAAVSLRFALLSWLRCWLLVFPGTWSWFSEMEVGNWEWDMEHSLCCFTGSPEPSEEQELLLSLAGVAEKRPVLHGAPVAVDPPVLPAVARGYRRALPWQQTAQESWAALCSSVLLHAETCRNKSLQKSFPCGDFALLNFCGSSFKCNLREVSASLFAVY